MSTLVQQSESSVLGKRARDDYSFVLQLDSDASIEAKKQNPPIIINGKLTPDTKRRYKCTYSACQKSYSKPSRLAEHERSHTGQRPFVCQTCNKSYLRETHLHAHSRSHLPESSRPFLCLNEGCDKRFWTTQHLRVHTNWHDGVRPYQCSEAQCNETFAKNTQLRAHVSTVHCAPGTKPYQCEHDGCTRSFGTNQHLRSHMKVHDELRYTCVHYTCIPKSGAAPVYYPNWTSLRHHIRTVHPPVCTHPSCDDRVFSSQKNLRAHQKLHEQRDLETEMGGGIGPVSESSDFTQVLHKGRRGGEIGRDWNCDEGDCDKDFKSKKALSIHKNIAHLGRRDHMCPHEGCERAYGYKHLLNRHLAKVHTMSTDDEQLHDDHDLEDIPNSELQPKVRAIAHLSIDTITGQSYTIRMQANIANAVALSCPYPHVNKLMRMIPDNQGAPPLNTGTPCDYAFSRAYDLRRHLKSVHGLDIVKDSVDQWVSQTKAEKRHSM